MSPSAQTSTRRGFGFLSRHGTPYVEIRRPWQLSLMAAGLATEQIYRSALSGRRRAIVMALEFGGGTANENA